MPDLGGVNDLTTFDDYVVYLEGASIILKNQWTGEKTAFSNADISPVLEYGSGQILSQGVNNDTIYSGSIGIKKGHFIGTSATRIDETRTNNRHGVWIHGQGKGTTLEFQGSSGTPLDAAFKVGMAGVEITNMRIIMNQYVTHAIYEYGDHLNTDRRTDQCHYDRLQIEGPNGNGGMYNPTTPYFSGQRGIFIDGTAVASFFTRVTNCNFIGLDVGVWCYEDNATTVTVDRCDFIAVESPIKQSDGSGQNAFTNIFIQGGLAVCTTGIDISGSGKNTIIDNIRSEINREVASTPVACQTVKLNTGVVDTYIGYVNNVWENYPGNTTSKAIVDSTGDLTKNYYEQNIIAKKQHYLRFEDSLVKTNSAVKYNFFSGQMQYYGNNSTWDKYYKFTANYAYNLDSDVEISFPDMRASGSGQMVVHNAPSVFSTKTINPVDNVMPYYEPTAFAIHQHGGAVKLRNNGTGEVTSYATLGPAVDAVLANTNDPSVIIHSGWYDLAAGFTGWNAKRHMKIFLMGNVFINVPAGYTGNVWNFSPNNDVLYYMHMKGGIYDEQDPQENNWNCLDFTPTGSSPYGAVYASKFEDMVIWRCNKPINCHTSGMSWINQNHFENIYAEVCKWIGAYFVHDGGTAYTPNSNGMLANTFINVSGQASAGNAAEGYHYPACEGGWRIAAAQWTNVWACNPWDIYLVPAASPMVITSEVEGTDIKGGLVAQIDEGFIDDSPSTTISDRWNGIKSWKGVFTGRHVPTNAHGYDPALVVQRYVDTNGFENIARFTRTGSLDMLTMENGSNATGSYATIFRAMALSNNFPDWLEPLLLQSYIKNALDTASSNPLLILAARTAQTPFLIANRPLVSVRNYNTDLFLFWKDRLDLNGNKLTNAVLDLANVDITHASQAQGDILVNNGSEFTRKGKGTAFQVLRVKSDASDVEYASLDSERTGKALANGTGAQTQFTIAHGLGATPSYVFVDCASHAIARTFTVDGTNITVNFASAPGSGTNNVIIYWRVVA